MTDQPDLVDDSRFAVIRVIDKNGVAENTNKKRNMRSPSNVFCTGKSSEKLNGMEKKQRTEKKHV